MMYSLAKQGVFRTIQGEGTLMGLPMVFVRLAGCPVGCPQCDTDYTVNQKVEVKQLAELIVSAMRPTDEWVWFTGGEPTIYDLAPVINILRRTGLRLALATAGINPVQIGRRTGSFDFVSVSPHSKEGWMQKRGDQVNLVAGLNGLNLCEWRGADFSGFSYKFVTPCDGKPETLAECRAWIDSNAGWRLGIQSHKIWGIA